MVIRLARDVVDVEVQLGETDPEGLVFKLFSAQAVPSIDNFTVISQNIGHAFILGHAANGQLGTANGIDGSQITLGSGGLGASSLHHSASG